MLKKTFVPAVITGAMLAGAAQLSLADAVATAFLDVYDFKLTNDAGQKLVVGQDINFTSAVTNDGDTYANLNGVIEEDSESAVAAPGGLRVDASCVGDCAYVEDTFSYVQYPATATNTYVVGDVVLDGAIVDIGGPTPDADAKTLAEVSLVDPTNVGTAAGNNVGVQGTFQFTVNYTGDLNISFTADQYIRARLAAFEAGIDANASTSWSISMIDQATGIDLLETANWGNNLGLLTRGRSATTPGQDFVVDVTGLAFATSVSVVAGQVLQVTIDHASDANAQLIRRDIPAPASVALFGIGLLGLGAVRRRKLGA